MVSHNENQPRARQSDANDGKDPVRVEAGKKAAETRKRHQQEAAEAHGNESSGAGGDAQEKNPNRVEGGTRKSNASESGDSSHHQGNDGKDPVHAEAGKKDASHPHHHNHQYYVELGHKGADARWHGHEKQEHGAETAHNESYGEKDPVRVEAGKKAAAHFDHQHFVELGHMGAEARWHGHEKQEDAGNNQGTHHAESHQQQSGEVRREHAAEHEKDPVRVEAGKKAAAHFDHEHFVEMGRKSGEVRREHAAEHEHEKDPVRIEAGKKAASHFDHEHFVELGHMGAEARWHGHEQHDDGAGDAHDKQGTPAATHQQHEKDPVRVEAGKKAASHFDHEHFAEMGRKSGEVRREHAEHHEKDPVRVEAGKKAAAHFDHEHFVELGHMGAEARYGKHHHDDESPSDDPKAKNPRVEGEADPSNKARQGKE